MPNPDAGNLKTDLSGRAKSPPTPAGGMGREGSKGSMTEKTANFGGLPGKIQSKDRSGGIKKLKTYPQSEGL